MAILATSSCRIGSYNFMEAQPPPASSAVSFTLQRCCCSWEAPVNLHTTLYSKVYLPMECCLQHLLHPSSKQIQTTQGTSCSTLLPPGKLSLSRENPFQKVCKYHAEFEPLFKNSSVKSTNLWAPHFFIISTKNWSS